ncbi:DUF742 domain-containing protein [Demequina sp. SYSU T00039]|uniref:DUF742 domain-containing protein n=1 Tax=Demequina lignilytica TaxID=3051663 RepID=A0AAW7M2N6_9MICO|nr:MULTISPECIES: DUF742 domain-containing protein [unclassified Demequina]MDN4477693.1 DUF742 domain-containing protein [Demequina sp. SYSU T00039-1]MDN4487602.1 DUF742 domain-containing protein [Demequina sp. SYSU T00039]MDN4491313.1 DUF742 domain-containing protein [Demequina sp. SYSU T00068]
MAHDEDEAYTVRPYAVTGGRVSAASADLPMEALVEATTSTEALTGLTPEKKKILQLATGQYQSVAELSAHTRLPLGVVRVLVTDLAEVHYLKIHIGGTAQDAHTHDASGGLSLSLLESVLDGIAAL